jgi:hypothetical protein
MPSVVTGLRTEFSEFAFYPNFTAVAHERLANEPGTIHILAHKAAADQIIHSLIKFRRFYPTIARGFRKIPVVENV